MKNFYKSIAILIFVLMTGINTACTNDDSISTNLSGSITVKANIENSAMTRAVTYLPKDTRFRIQAYAGTTLQASILYKISDDTGNAQIENGEGVGFEVSPDGSKHFRLVPGEVYTFIGYSWGTTSDPGKIEFNSTTIRWKSNYINWRTIQTITNGENQINISFSHQTASIQVVLNNTENNANITAASAIVWKEQNMPISMPWNLLENQYGVPATITGSETDSDANVPISWTNPNSQTATSNLQFFIPGTYKTGTDVLKIKIKNITAEGINYNSIDPIELTSLALMEKNKTYKVTLKFTPPKQVELKNIEVIDWVNNSTTYEGVTYRLDVSGSKYTLTKAAQTKAVGVYTDYVTAWTAKVTVGSSWLTLAVSSGVTNDWTDLNYNVTENNSGAIRTGTILITSGNLVKEITITQNPTN